MEHLAIQTRSLKQTKITSKVGFGDTGERKLASRYCAAVAPAHSDRERGDHSARDGWQQDRRDDHLALPAQCPLRLRLDRKPRASGQIPGQFCPNGLDATAIWDGCTKIGLDSTECGFVSTKPTVGSAKFWGRLDQVWSAFDQY